MTELRRTLAEDVFYPEHAPRTASALYTAFVDSDEQMEVICDVHHRGPNRGKHMITGPVWQLQRYERGDWSFTGGGQVAATTTSGEVKP